jgi:hypothetical protein
MFMATEVQLVDEKDLADITMPEPPRFSAQIQEDLQNLMDLDKEKITVGEIVSIAARMGLLQR